MSGTTGIVAFDPAYFVATYPAFSTVPQDTLASYFSQAGIILNNTPTSVVQDASIGGRRYILLHLLTAHFAQLFSGSNGQAASGLVGRINNATEGSVSVGTDMGNQPASAAWFMQTQYGATFWTLTMDLRTATYVSGRRWSGYVC